VLALNTELTPALVWEGIAKDAIRLIQDLRKRTDCQFTDRIRVTLRTQSETLVQALAEHRDFICQETLAVELVLLTEPLSNPDAAVELADEPVSIELVVVKGS
jgi:isoleucyl-tRNA synthetase